MAGHGSTPLWRKIGYKAGMRVACVGAPDQYLRLLADGPAVVHAGDDLDLVHAFCPDQATAQEVVESWQSRIRPSGVLWMSWPREPRPGGSDLSEDVVRDLGLAAGLLDVKSCAVDDAWAGLKFVRRARDHPTVPAPPQRL